MAMTGSVNLQTQGTMTVPTAMLCAASSIHHSPLSQSEPPCVRLVRLPSDPVNAPAECACTPFAALIS